MTHYGDAAGRLLLSRNAILNIVNSNRNYGKTWTFKRRGVRRFFRRGKKTLWLRVFKEEAKEALNSFFSSKDLQDYCGVIPWDKETKTGNMRREGNRIYLRKGRKWEWVFMVGSLAEAGKMRGCDDVKLDTIILDEYAKTPAQLCRYVGNMVTDFFDIFFSVKREHEVRAILLGNKESHANPFLAYFGIQPPRASWEGIRSYRSGTICLQQINNQQAESGYQNRIDEMMNGTSYGNYLRGEVKGAVRVRVRRPPAEASLYAQIDFDGAAFAIKQLNGIFYVGGAIDKGRGVFASGTAVKYPKQWRLVNKSKTLFKAFVSAVECGRVFYSSAAVAEAVGPFLAFLGAK